MPKKGTRHPRDQTTAKKCRKVETAASDVRAKNFRSVHIGVSNGRRWLTLKKRLGLQSDEDLAVYLLDLADSIVRRDNKCNEVNTWKKDGDKKTDVELTKSNNCSPANDEPLRRSTRKQNTNSSPEPKVPSEETIQSVQSEVLDDVIKLHVKHSYRSKHHRSKTKHHKEKRKKKKHRNIVENASSNDESESNGEVASEIPVVVPNVSEETTDDWKKESKETEESKEVENIKNLIPSNENTEVTNKNIARTTEVIKRVSFTENMNGKFDKEESKPLESNTSILERSIEDFSLFHDLTTSSAVNGIEEMNGAEKHDQMYAELDKTLGHDVDTNLEKNAFNQNDDQMCLLLSSNAMKENMQNPKDDRKVKKRRKRLKREVKEDHGAIENDGSEETMHKHRKRKHKHVGEHKNKKHHDVRKAPQDGIIILQQEKKEIYEIEDAVLDIPDLQPDDNTDGSLTEPQRLAIKIKLCQDCNSRHLQDACPLTTPQYKIDDSITLEEWLNNLKSNVDVIKVANSEDPMSEGYGRLHDEGSESEDDSGTVEQQFKSKAKVEREENTLKTDPERPIFARDSLPEYFELKLTNTKHGLGVYVKQPVPMYAKLGPLIGKPIKEMDIPDDFSMRHIWEINDNGKTSYISTTNPLNSSWIRYVRPSYRKEDRTSTVITRQGELYLITTQNLTIGMELTYWADSQCSAWNRKNKMDKTNCGGCNLNFHHSIYYRLHCWIFHDTNYSLTIRKYHCKVCGAAVLGKDNIVKHAAELHAGRGAYQCQYCKKFFLRLNYLEMHRTYGCSQNPQRSRPLCDFCGRKFCQPQKLKVHIKRMHSDMSEVLREFQCKSCLKLLGSRAALQRHMKEVHHKDVVGAATCDRCGKMFQNKSNLKIHMLTHSGVKPFKCKENGCKAAFTTKQCLQFHYKKVHGLTEEMMPKIERSVAYTFDAYSGGLVEDVGRGKTPRFNRRNSQDNSNSLPSVDECSSESLRVDNATNHAITEFPLKTMELKLNRESRTPPISTQPIVPMPTNLEASLDTLRDDVDLYGGSRIQSKGSKKWLGEFNPPPNQELPTAPDVYEFEDERKDMTDKTLEAPAQVLVDESKISISVYRRPESTSASLLVEAALDAAEREIGAVSSPILEENDRENHLYSISSQLQSPLPPRSPESHLDSYIQQQDELMSPAPTPDNRHTPPSHLHVDYHLHRPMEYINTNRTHNIEQYLHHEDIQRVSSPNGYIHVQQEELASPSATPNPRYQDLHHHHHHHHHHHQVPTDNLSSDEGDSVAQNLCLSAKEKSLQLDLSTSYKYDSLESEFTRDRNNFDTLVLNSGEAQGLDMTARGYHHSFGAQVQNRYHHHHIYEMPERQSVDLSRTGGYPMSSPPPLPPPPPYPHSDVLRVVSLDLTPGGRHTVDLSLSRSHHLHSSGTRIPASPPQPAGSAAHIVPENLEGRILSPPPPPPPPLPGYNPAYPVSPAPYHPPRPGYHHYSGYY